MVIYGVTNAAVGIQAQQRDALEDGPGYTCFGGPGVSQDGVRLLAGWAPGTQATRFAAGTGLRVFGGRTLIMQVHYHTEDGVVPDQTAVDLELADCTLGSSYCLSPREAFSIFITAPLALQPGLLG